MSNPLSATVSQEKLERECGQEVVALQADVTDQERMKVVVEEKYGPIQTLVYNAGNGVWKKYNELTVKELVTCFAVNTSGLLTAASYSRANSNYFTVSPIERRCL